MQTVVFPEPERRDEEIEGGENAAPRRFEPRMHLDLRSRTDGGHERGTHGVVGFNKQNCLGPRSARWHEGL
jgi:hypothetical protein